ncbi:MAG: hypothetical protein MZW92_32255 [Comamonadaceae bacterium]|nr:hypothetical protein [Comamonadaceae bacterium]
MSYRDDPARANEAAHGICLLTVNRPQALNALAPQVLYEIAAAVGAGRDRRRRARAARRPAPATRRSSPARTSPRCATMSPLGGPRVRAPAATR